jgi:MFS family permease
VFIVYLVIGLAMPVLPLHVHRDLGLSTLVVGIVAGCQFATALISRIFAGQEADRRGGKRAVMIGLAVAVVSGFLYLLSLRFIAEPVVSVTILLVGRALLGGAESFIVMGAFAWGLPLIGSRNTGTFMSWIGVAMYVAYAIGAPAGMRFYASDGFGAIGVATVVIPCVSIALLAPFAGAKSKCGKQIPLRDILRLIWIPGLGLALTAVGFGAITTFISLLFSQHGWERAWIALSAVSISFVLGRVFLGQMPDRVGGPKIALICAIAEAVGLALIWIATAPPVVFAGAALAGLGYSLIFPAFGVEALRRVPAQNRGLASGAYTAFLDFALGVSSPLLGLIANAAGLRNVYLASALVVATAGLVALFMIRRAKRSSGASA